MVEMASLPSIPSLKLRHFQGEADFAPMASVITASELADQSPRLVSEQDLASAYQRRLLNCDPFRDMVIAEVGGQVVGYCRGWWENGEACQRLYHHNAFLLPQWRRKHIGHAMLLWMEQHLAEIAATHPSELEKLYQVSVSHYQQGASLLLERCGYQPVRYYFQMLRLTMEDIPDFPLPEGLEVRPVTPDHYPAIWQAVVESSLDEWGSRELTQQDYENWLSSPEFQPELWQVAWDTDTGQVAGEVLTYVQYEENKQFNRQRGYTEGIGVIRSWRRRGLARALISRSLQAQKAAGMRESALVVDTDNTSGAIRLYEACGFRVAKRDTLYRKPMEMD